MFEVFDTVRKLPVEGFERLKDEELAKGLAGHLNRVADSVDRYIVRPVRPEPLPLEYFASFKEQALADRRAEERAERERRDT